MKQHAADTSVIPIPTGGCGWGLTIQGCARSTNNLVTDCPGAQSLEIIRRETLKGFSAGPPYSTVDPTESRP